MGHDTVTDRLPQYANTANVQATTRNNAGFNPNVKPAEENTRPSIVQDVNFVAVHNTVACVAIVTSANRFQACVSSAWTA